MSNNIIRFEDYSKQVIDAIDRGILNALEEVSGELEGRVKDNTREDTGKTKASWSHRVDEHKFEAYVGSNYENAIWEEFGTGTEALNGNGRKDVPWVYQSEDGKWHRTKGKKPSRALKLASDNIDSLIKEYFKERFKNL